MRALIDLRRFINAKNTDEERAEIREYLLANAMELSAAFGVSLRSFQQAVGRVDDDQELSRRVLDNISTTTKQGRHQRQQTRAKVAQQSAGILGAVAIWSDDRAELDVPSLLACVLTRPNDMLVFVSDTFVVGVRMGHLFTLRKLRRRDLTGWVDANGLHIRWTTGGLNLRPSTEPHATRVILPLAARSATVAA
jgi:hypothetical protein